MCYLVMVDIARAGKPASKRPAEVPPTEDLVPATPRRSKRPRTNVVRSTV